MPAVPSSILSFLAQPYSLSDEQIAFFDTYRYIKLKGVLNEETVAYYAQIISEKVAELSREERPLTQRDTYGKAFLQLFRR